MSISSAIIFGVGMYVSTRSYEYDEIFNARENKFAPEPRTDHEERIAAAEAKRQRRMKRNLKNLKR